MNEKNKVLEFPKSKIVREVPPNIEELERAKEKGLRNFADGVLDELAGGLLVEIENYGIDTETQSFAKDISFTVDALRASIYRSIGIEHHLHKFIDENITVRPLEEIRRDMENEKIEEEIEDNT